MPLKHACLLLVLSLLPLLAAAFETARPLVVVSSLPLTGDAGEAAESLRAGIATALNEYNATRPPSAPRLQFIVRDDGGDSERQQRNLRELTEEHQPIALLGCYGERACQDAEQFASRRHLALLAPMAANSQVCRRGSVAFCLHASHEQEAQALARQLRTLGETRVALLISGNLAAYRSAVEQAFAAGGLATKTYLLANGRAEFATQLGEVVTAHKGERVASVLLLDTAAAALATEQLRGANPLAMIAAFSSIAPYRWLQRVQTKAVGTLVSHSLPDPDVTTLPLGKQYGAAISKYAEQDLPPDHEHLEAYLGGRLLGELLKAGQTRRETLLRTLQAGWQGEFGGHAVDFTQGRRLGGDKIQLGIVGRRGVFIY